MKAPGRRGVRSLLLFVPEQEMPNRLKSFTGWRFTLLAVACVAAGFGAFRGWRAWRAEPVPVPLGSHVVRIEPLAGGLNGLLDGNVANVRKQLIPVDMTPLGDGRQLVLTLTGHVRLLRADGTLAPGAYLETYNDRSPPPFGAADDKEDYTQIGNTSLAAHPGFLDPDSPGYGKFYVITTERPGTGPADFDDGGPSLLDNVVTEWTLAPDAVATATRLTADGPGANVTAREVLRCQRPGILHTLADMAFLPDGTLLVTSGDGGGNAFPNTDGSAFEQDRYRNGQDPRNIFGTILRIDPLARPNDPRPAGGHAGQYRVPPDNWGATDGDPATPAEIYTYGNRSPYRLNVDREAGTVYVGDVGEESREEIDRIVNGGNYGWGVYEGTMLFRADLLPRRGTAPRAPFVGPVWELYHFLDGGRVTEANNVVGGFVYRGRLLPELRGKYLFADTGEDDDGEPNNVLDLYCGDLDKADGDARAGLERLRVELPDGVKLPDRIWSIAEDERGELYLLVGPDRLDLFDRTSEQETDGGIWRLTAARRTSAVAAAPSHSSVLSVPLATVALLAAVGASAVLLRRRHQTAQRQCTGH